MVGWRAPVGLLRTATVVKEWEKPGAEPVDHKHALSPRDRVRSVEMHKGKRL